ncbi:MAG: hypothetical protein JXB03_11940 [Spirochaetales bacterium]|nr:hypothetical protein [Spirochaetales bacterium]
MKKMRVMLLFTVLTAIACVTGGEPTWIADPPKDTPSTLYFTGIGSSVSGDEAEAYSQAVAGLVAEITRIIGVEISSEVSVYAAEVLGEFQSTVKQSVLQRSSARVEGFKVADRYVENNGGILTVHLLAAYEKKALDAELMRIQRLLAERQEAVSGPEGEGEALLSRGLAYSAALKYIEAAGAAARAEIDNNRIKFERNVNKAKAALSGLSITVTTAQVTGMKDESLPLIEVMVVNTEGLPQRGVPLRASFRTLRDDNRFTTSVTELLTEADGTAVLRLPVPRFVGEEKVTFSFDLRGPLDTFSTLTGDMAELAEGIELVAGSKRQTVSYRVVSPLSGMRVVVAARDLDSSGKDIQPSQISVGMMEVLAAADFLTMKSDISLNNGSPGELGRAAAQAAGVSSGRVMLGQAQVVEYSQDDGKTLVKVSGTGYLVDIATGNVIYTSAGFQKSAIGSTAQSALVSAFRQLGKLIAEDLVNNVR